uniref:Putative ovule protein n=1 Tax=Solanum chacoense TaxID=4108 RepID=A0A0V0H1S9_SOLCH
MHLRNLFIRAFQESRHATSSPSTKRRNLRMMCCSDLQNWISTYSRCCTSKNSVKYQGGGKIWIL